MARPSEGRGRVLLSTLLLLFGILVTASGILALTVGSFGKHAKEEVEQDNDGDGKVNEDPPGDADDSASDLTKVDSVCEAQNPADDDGDCVADEDPKDLPGVESVSETAGFAGKLLLMFGIGLLLLFAVFSIRRPKPEIPSALGTNPPTSWSPPRF